MKNKEIMDIVFILDRSGSMQGIEKDTIGGFNSYIKEQKDSEAKVTTILFDDKYEMLHDRVDIKKVKKLTNKEYYVRGCTALYDAIGKTINYMDSKDTNKVMFIITTDGYENASKEFNKEKVKELIKGHSKWEFMYIGANIDSYYEGSNLGIKQDNISNYVQDEKGVKKLFSAIGKATKNFECDRYIGCDWKEELEDYINKTRE